MRNLSSRRRRERGAAAVEFALVLPMFLCALGLVMNVGIGFFARFQLTNYASAAARSCVSQVNVNSAALGGCVNQYMSSTDLSTLEGLCNNLTVTPMVMPGPSNNPAMQILQVQVTCNAMWVTFANAINLEDRTSWMITVKSQMPFAI